MSVHYLFNLMSFEVLNFFHNFKRKCHDTLDMMFFMFSLRLSSCYIFICLFPAKQQSVLKGNLAKNIHYIVETPAKTQTISTG
jgi:hypothetical protein